MPGVARCLRDLGLHERFGLSPFGWAVDTAGTAE